MHSIALTSFFATCPPLAERLPAHVSERFKLSTHRALTMRPKSSGVLRVTQGSAWVTFNDAANDASVQAGDHFLNSNQDLHIKAGQVLVMEALSADVVFDFSFDAQNLVVLSQKSAQFADRLDMQKTQEKRRN